jgi:hypothetical protein
MNAVMRLSARPRSRMPGMAMGFIDHLEAFGRKGLGQLLGNDVSGGDVSGRHAASSAFCETQKSGFRPKMLKCPYLEDAI